MLAYTEFYRDLKAALYLLLHLGRMAATQLDKGVWKTGSGHSK